ncbi:MAG TPA: YicC family protein [Ruminococcaceae bacterium]|nr:YicC family protein [Oscillospiraceae bacterium]
MTGFGRAKKNFDGFDITVEIRSVNHRFFEFSSRLPRAYLFLDDKIKSCVQKRVSRGKIEASVMLEITDGASVVLDINRDYVNAYICALRQIGKEYKIKDDLKLSSLVGNNDILAQKRKEIDEEILTDAVLQTVDDALTAFVDMRAAEGERLRTDVISRTETILDKVSFVEERSPETVREYRRKIEQRIRELIGDVQIDEQRLLTETAVFADKVAVAEETVRLRSHIKELNNLFEAGGVIGRKLDFIVQEMNREANTIGSKCSDMEITKAVVDIKAEIEKIREQIQNIE